MSITIPGDVLMHRDMRIDDVDSGLPLLSWDLTGVGGTKGSLRLAPCAVRALVDALVGVAEPAPGEVRMVVKVRAEDLPRMFPGGQRYLLDRGE